MKKFVFAAVLAGIFLFGCSSPSPDTAATEQELVTKTCVSLCLQEKQKNLPDWNDGLCLGNPFSGTFSNWVCDVAHSPREAVDNLAENQCSAFREGRASHFVEVDTDCGVIKTV